MRIKFQITFAKTKAYYEVLLMRKIYERSAEARPFVRRPLFTKKIQIAVAIPPSNDVDLFTNDLD